MEFNSQIYTAPSIPKMSRRNISSAVVRGAQTVSGAPKLKKTKFSFFGSRNRQVSGKSLQVDKSVDTLQETNNILVEIQKQLRFDFFSRITERQQNIRRFKQQSSREKALLKEKSIESVGKFAGGIIKTFSKVMAPAKSIFQRILDFFQIILTGLIVNTAFKWLEKKENREALSRFFNFIADHWKWILGTFAVAKIVGLVLKLKRIATALGLLGRGGTPGGGVGNICQQVMSCFATSVVPFLSANPRVVNQLGTSLLGSRQFLTGLALAFPTLGLPLLPGSSPTPAPTPTQSPFSKPGFDWAGFADAVNQSVSSGVAFTAAALIALASLFVVPAAKGGTIGEIPMKKKKCSACSLGFSQGGSVGGRGSGNVDSVPAMLAPGEEVIKTSAATLFRPLLKDINDNAGRLWSTFSAGVAEMLDGNEILKATIFDINQQLSGFSEVLEKFTFTMEQDRLKKQNEGGPATALPTIMPMMTAGEQVISKSATKQFEPVLKQINVVRQRKKKSSPTIIPMNLPAIVKGGEEDVSDLTSGSGGTASSEPSILSVNAANPYMQITPDIYGIFV